ncbi:MAG: hypothetical protein GY807_18960 [Gammaproteobacteria bacterium]|nr:hypothetical protein [Gammaproteobacteria bacterium]
MNVGIACTGRQYKGIQDFPFPYLIEGLKAQGHSVQVCNPNPYPTFRDIQALFSWQWLRNPEWVRMMDDYRERGARCFTMERGWFDRYEYTQIDHQGFNHTASWSPNVSLTAPREGVGRYQSLCERLSPRIGVKRRQSGYILLLGQTGGDTQMRHSEIHHPAALCESVVANLPAGLEVKFRPHPQSKYRPSSVDVIGGTLEDALAGAQYALTINSNAGNDALWWGCPVMCFGPALYEIAGAARRTTIATLMHDLEFMTRWEPDEKRVTSYFHWLASRQWNRDELKQGSCLEQLLGEI